MKTTRTPGRNTWGRQSGAALLCGGCLALLGAVIWHSGERVDRAGVTVLRVAYPEYANKPLQQLWASRFAEYERRHSDVRIVRVFADWNKQDIMTAADMLPDIYFSNSFYTFKERLRAEDLTPYIRRDNAEFRLDDWIPELIEDCRFEDRILALPWYFNIALLYYNVDLFKSAGIPPPNDAWTWDDYVTVAQRFNRFAADGRPVQWGTACVFGWWEEWLTHVNMAGGTLFSDDWTRCRMDTPEAIRGMAFFHDLVLIHRVSPAPQDGVLHPFLNGKSAINWGGHTMDWPFLRTNARFEWDVALLPAGPKTRAGGERVSATFCIYRKSRHKEQAWDLLKFLTSYETGREWCRVGLTPVRRSVAQDFFLKKNAQGGFDESPQHRETALRAIQYGVNQPQMPNFMEVVLRFFQPEVDKMLRGQAKPEEVCRRATAKANQFLRMMGTSRAELAKERGL